MAHLLTTAALQRSTNTGRPWVDRDGVVESVSEDPAKLGKTPDGQAYLGGPGMPDAVTNRPRHLFVVDPCRG